MTLSTQSYLFLHRSIIFGPPVDDRLCWFISDRSPPPLRGTTDTFRVALLRKNRINVRIADTPVYLTTRALRSEPSSSWVQAEVEVEQEELLPPRRSGNPAGLVLLCSCFLQYPARGLLNEGEQQTSQLFSPLKPPTRKLLFELLVFGHV